MNTNNGGGSKLQTILAVLAILIAIVSVIIGLLTWLMPYNPVGESPLVPVSSTQTNNTPTMPSSLDTEPTSTQTLSATNTPGISYKPPLCGDLAYKVDFFDDGGITKTNLTFEFPNGYTEGFFTSDPGVVEFSDGQVKTFNTQFTLVTSGFSLIKINGVIARQEPPIDF